MFRCVCVCVCVWKWDVLIGDPEMFWQFPTSIINIVERNNSKHRYIDGGHTHTITTTTTPTPINRLVLTLETRKSNSHHKSHYRCQHFQDLISCLLHHVTPNRWPFLVHQVSLNVRHIVFEVLSSGDPFIRLTISCLIYHIYLNFKLEMSITFHREIHNVVMVVIGVYILLVFLLLCAVFGAFLIFVQFNELFIFHVFWC